MKVSSHDTCDHGTIIQTGITCKKIPSQRFIEFNMVLKKNSTHHKLKAEIFLLTRPPTCRKPDPCLWFVRRGKQRVKANL